MLIIETFARAVNAHERERHGLRYRVLTVALGPSALRLDPVSKKLPGERSEGTKHLT